MASRRRSLWRRLPNRPKEPIADCEFGGLPNRWMSPANIVHRPMISNLRIHWTILKTCLEERLVYRADFAFGTLVRFLPIVTQIFLWGAIYAVAPDGNERRINGYTYRDMVAYFLLAMVARAF